MFNMHHSPHKQRIDEYDIDISLLENGVDMVLWTCIHASRLDSRDIFVMVDSLIHQKERSCLSTPP